MTVVVASDETGSVIKNHHQVINQTYGISHHHYSTPQWRLQSIENRECHKINQNNYCNLLCSLHLV